MSAWALVAEARRHGLEFAIVGGDVRVRAPADELNRWVTRLRPHRSTICALLAKHEPCGARGNALEVARTAAAVGAAIGVLSVGGRLCAYCLRIDQCVECADGSRVCWRCIDRAQRAFDA
jgi:hypothetical protein